LAPNFSTPAASNTVGPLRQTADLVTNSENLIILDSIRNGPETIGTDWQGNSISVGVSDNLTWYMTLRTLDGIIVWYRTITMDLTELEVDNGSGSAYLPLPNDIHYDALNDRYCFSSRVRLDSQSAIFTGAAAVQNSFELAAHPYNGLGGASSPSRGSFSNGWYLILDAQGNEISTLPFGSTHSTVDADGESGIYAIVSVPNGDYYMTGFARPMSGETVIPATTSIDIPGARMNRAAFLSRLTKAVGGSDLVLTTDSSAGDGFYQGEAVYLDGDFLLWGINWDGAGTLGAVSIGYLYSSANPAGVPIAISTTIPNNNSFGAIYCRVGFDLEPNLVAVIDDTGSLQTSYFRYDGRPLSKVYHDQIGATSNFYNGYTGAAPGAPDFTFSSVFLINIDDNLIWGARNSVEVERIACAFDDGTFVDINGITQRIFDVNNNQLTEITDPIFNFGNIAYMCPMVDQNNESLYFYKTYYTSATLPRTEAGVDFDPNGSQVAVAFYGFAENIANHVSGIALNAALAGSPVTVELLVPNTYTFTTYTFNPGKAIFNEFDVPSGSSTYSVSQIGRMLSTTLTFFGRNN
jgi:hypothetical protein